MYTVQTRIIPENANESTYSELTELEDSDRMLVEGL